MSADSPVGVVSRLVNNNAGKTTEQERLNNRNNNACGRRCGDSPAHWSRAFMPPTDMSAHGDGTSAPMHLQTPPSADTSPAGRGLDDEMQRLANEHLRNLKQVPAALQTPKDPPAVWLSPLFDRVSNSRERGAAGELSVQHERNVEGLIIGDPIAGNNSENFHL